MHTDIATHRPSRPERRRGADRRHRTPPLWSKFWLTGRRTHMRRKEDRQQSFRIDRHSFRTLAAVMSIVILSITDGMLTLYLVEHGASEVNPLLAYFLERGPLSFFGFKYFLTCACIVLVLVNKDIYLFRTTFRIKVLFIVFMIPFLLVIIWELYLIFVILP